MSTLQNWTPNQAEAYFNGSLIGQVSTYLAEAVGELSGHRHAQRNRADRTARLHDRAGNVTPSRDRPVDATTSREPHRDPRPARRSPRRGVLARLEARIWRQEQKRREAWLAQSTDIFDLERRIRQLDRGESPF